MSSDLPVRKSSSQTGPASRLLIGESAEPIHVLGGPLLRGLPLSDHPFVLKPAPVRVEAPPTPQEGNPSGAEQQVLTSWQREQEEKRAKERERAQLSLEVESLKGKKAMLESQLGSLESEVQGKEEALQALQQRHDHLQQELAKRRVELDEARKEAETLREQAREQGYRQGLAAGMEEGKKLYETAKTELESYYEAAQQQVIQIQEEMQRLFEERFTAQEEPLKKLVLDVAEQVIRHQVTEFPHLLEQVLREALERLAHAEKVRLLVPREQLQWFAEKKELIREAAPRAEQIAVAPHHLLKPGDMIVETDRGTVDARVKEKLAAVEQNLA